MRVSSFPLGGQDAAPTAMTRASMGTNFLFRDTNYEKLNDNFLLKAQLQNQGLVVLKSENENGVIPTNRKSRQMPFIIYGGW